MAISNTVTPRTYTRSPGAYKGIAINPGTDQDIASQIARINASQSSPVAAPTAPVSSGNSTTTSTPNPKVKGLVQPKSFTTRVDDIADAAKPTSTQKRLTNTLTEVSRPTSTQTGLIKDLRNTAQGNFAIGDKAARISDMYGSQIARVGGLGAAAQAGYNSTGTNIVGAGNAAIASQSASQRMSALAAGQTAALQGTAQQLTGQGQAATAQNAALGGANTQQANQVSGVGAALGAANVQQSNTLTGLNNAASLAQPVQIAPGSTLASPVTGETVAGGLGGYVNYQTAEQVMGLIRQYPDAQYIYDESKSPQDNLRAFQGQALQNSPTYQKSTYGVPGSNSFAGATQQQTAAAGYSEATQAYNQLSAVNNAAHAQAQTVKDILARGGINEGIPDYNRAVNQLSGRLGSENIAAFNTAIAEMQNMYSQILATGGGTPTGQEQTALMALNPNSSAAQINAAIAQLESAAYNKLKAQYDLAAQYQSNLGGGGSTGGGGGDSVGWF